MAETKDGNQCNQWQMFIKNVLDDVLSSCEYSLCVHMGFWCALSVPERGKTCAPLQLHLPKASWVWMPGQEKPKKFETSAHKSWHQASSETFIHKHLFC